ncbi:hypothetical protein [Pandoraea sp. NPDC087047]|uniref:hypothetical protein n=1 Tax=Pandoraea sp. NPDC087047 TaxID=3364390 RepID=UPI00381AB7B1
MSNWSAVFAVALVANLAAPAVCAAPSRPFASGRRVGRDPSSDIAAPPADASSHVPDQVDIQPVQRAAIKTEYSFPDVMRALASSSAPFRNLGKVVGDTHAAATGDNMDRDTLNTMQRAGEFLDTITALVPAVQRIRVPGYAADVTANAVEGKVPGGERVSQVLTFADPRALGAGIPVHPGKAANLPVPAQPAPDPAPAQERAPEGDVGARLSDGGEPEKAAPQAAVDASPVDEVASGDTGAGADAEGHEDEAPASAPDQPNVPNANANAPSSAGAPRIEGEREYLQGYEQPLPSASLPAEPNRQLVVVGGQHYLAGEAGYYRVTREPQTGRWLVDAPRGTRAQVPVTYNAETGEWHAHAPLRLCGGGCGPSRESTPDSVALSQNQVADAIRHIQDRDVRDAIQLAYGDLANLHLLRSNREDLRRLRDNSIVEHRRMLVPQLMRLDPYSTLFEQQREAAEITAIHYDTYTDFGIDDLSPEAFCQENAEILFHYLLTRGVPSHHIRMVTVRPQGRPPHVLVLYTESDQFIDLLDFSTPQPPVIGHVDGMSSERFTAALFLTRDTTVLLDPWSRIKAVSFKNTDAIEELMSMLDVALADAGHRPSDPFTVSLTRPYPAPRDRLAETMASVSSLRSAASSASSGSSGSQSSASTANNTPDKRG